MKQDNISACGVTQRHIKPNNETLDMDTRELLGDKHKTAFSWINWTWCKLQPLQKQHQTFMAPGCLAHGSTAHDQYT